MLQDEHRADAREKEKSKVSEIDFRGWLMKIMSADQQAFTANREYPMRERAESGYGAAEEVLKAFARSLISQGETIIIKRAGVEIGRVTAEKLEYAEVFYRREPVALDSKLFTAKDTSGKPLFVVRVSEDKEITTERI